MNTPMTTPVNTLTDRNRLALEVLAAGAAVGILADLLLRATWGLNVTIVTAALVTLGAVIVRRHRLPVTPDAWWIAMTALLLGVAFVRRDAEMLQVLDVMGIFGAYALVMLSTQGVNVRDSGVVAYAVGAVVGFARSVVGSLQLVLGDIRWAELPREGRWRHARAVGLGVVLAVPLLVVFGGLFASADATFESVADKVVGIDFERAVSHIFFIGFWTAAAAGYLRTALLAKPTPVPTVSLSLGIVPVGTALGLLNLLFLVFVVTQAPYFYGGQAVVTQTTGLTLAQFARRGFFELVAVSALVLPVLLGADWATRDAAPRHRASFRALASLLLLQVGAVMGSAVFRMKLYVDQFGPSQDRIYASAFMGYLALASGWFAWTVLRGARMRFAFGAGTLGYAVLAALHIVNVDGMIARANVARAAAGADFDVRYHTLVLGGDAVPALLEALPRLNPAERYQTAQALVDRWSRPHDGDWRSWNWSTERARAAVAREASNLSAVPCVAGAEADTTVTSASCPPVSSER